MSFEIRRKLFHLLGLVYIAGIFLLPRNTFLGIVAGLTVLDFIFEVARLRNAALNQWVGRFGGGVMRDQEKSRISGVFWMLAGVLVTAFLIGPPEVVAVIYLYLVLGDTAASLLGKKIGGPTWGHSKKTIAGTVACFVVCLAVGIFMLRPIYAWSGIFWGAVGAAVFEFGLLSLNDNFTIPVGCSIMYLLAYGVRL